MLEGIYKTHAPSPPQPAPASAALITMPPENTDKLPERCQFQERRIKALEDKLFGNGREGIATRVDRMEAKMDTAIRLLRWQIATILTVGAIMAAVGYLPISP